MSDFGVYVHIPFCAHRCDYCAFATYSDRDHLMTQYVDCVVREINDAVGDGMPRALPWTEGWREVGAKPA